MCVDNRKGKEVNRMFASMRFYGACKGVEGLCTHVFDNKGVHNEIPSEKRGKHVDSVTAAVTLPL